MSLQKADNIIFILLCVAPILATSTASAANKHSEDLQQACSEFIT